MSYLQIYSDQDKRNDIVDTNTVIIVCFNIWGVMDETYTGLPFQQTFLLPFILVNNIGP